MTKTISEFNSNKYVVDRINDIIANLNEAFNADSPDEIIKWERAFLRELWPKLSKGSENGKNENERAIYKELFATAKKAQSIPRDIRISGGIGSGRVIYELEQISLKLMEYANGHGLLMTDKDDPRLATLKF